MKTFRCLEGHPAVQKFYQLCSIMEDLGVSLEFNSGKWDSGVGLVVDGEEYALHDVCGGDENHYLNHFPPMFECGLRVQREE